MRKKKVVLPTGGMRRRSKTTHHGKKRQTGTPIKLAVAVDTTNHNWPPPVSLLLTRRYPKAKWLVPQIIIPLFWFDSVMVQKKLLISIPPDLLIVDGRRFRVLMQEYRHVGTRGRGYTRWLVFEERNELADKGRP